MCKRKWLIGNCFLIGLVFALAGCGGGGGSNADEEIGDDGDGEVVLLPGNWDKDTWDNFLWR